MSHRPLACLFVVVALGACRAAPVVESGSSAAPEREQAASLEEVSPGEAAPTSTPTALLFDGLKLTPQPGWEVRPTTSSARVAQFELPDGAAGDPARLVIYHFGQGAGSIDANLDRWCGQFEQPDGRDSRDAARIEQRDIAGLTVHTIDLSGTYVAETSPGSGTFVNEPKRRLLAAIIVTPEGPYYLKLLGPLDVVHAWAPSFARFVDSAEPAP